jgi:hypothetical protein
MKRTPPQPIPEPSPKRSTDERLKLFPKLLRNGRSGSSCRDRNRSVIDSGASTSSIRESLNHLVDVIEEPCTGCEPEWIGRVRQLLVQLEQSLSSETAEPMASDFMDETAQAHPHLISLCAKFHEDGRVLLRQAAAVVLLSVRTYGSGAAPLHELRKATASLIEAVKSYQDLESELIGEASRDIGGDG